MAGKCMLLPFTAACPMNSDLQTFLDKYHTIVRRKFIIFIGILVLFSIVGVGIDMSQSSTIPLFWIQPAISILLTIYVIYKFRTTTATISQLRETLNRPDHVLKKMELEKKGKKNTYDGVSYSMKLIVHSSLGEESSFLLNTFQQNEALFNEGIQAFTAAYPKAEVKHFQES
jgi:hypothetical protein